MALIFGIAGACRREELYKLLIDDITDLGDIIIVRILDSKKNSKRSFTITGQMRENNLNLLSI